MRKPITPTRSVRRIVRWLLLGVLLIAPAGHLGCRKAAAPPPDVLLITVDSLRADRLSCYGHDVPTPNIDALAEAGTRFDNAVCDVTWTTPSMTSVMTGQFATVHGFKSTNTQQVDPANHTLAEILSEHGYSTTAVIGSFPLDSIYGLDQGFQRYDDEFTTSIAVTGDEAPIESVPSRFFGDPEKQRMHNLAKLFADSRRRDSEVTSAATEALRELDERRPFFLWVHYFGPHTLTDFGASGEERRKRHIEGYDARLAVTDAAVGGLLEALRETGLESSTLVVLHADHGESLGEHGVVGHGRDLYGPTLRVPLLLRWPGRVPAGRVESRLVANIDILPTVLDAAGIHPEEPLPGRSLLDLLADDGEVGDRAVYAETYMPAHSGFATEVRRPDGRVETVGLVKRGLRTERWKLVVTEPFPLFDSAEGSLPDVGDEVLAELSRTELYDLRSDPGERHDVAAEHPAVVRDLRVRLAAHLAEESEARSAPPLDLDPESEERLRALGYLGD